MKETKLDPKEEREYSELRKMGQRLHIPIPEVFIKMEVFDRDGKLIQRHHQRSHSWTRNAYNVLFCQLAACPAPDGTFEAGKLSIRSTAGVIKSHAGRVVAITDADQSFANSRMNTAGGMGGEGGGYLADSARIDCGIVVGSGVNAEDFEDYVLQTPIAEGAGAGQLNAVASELHNVSYGALTMTDELIRFFNNNSGGDVFVNEVALYASAHCDTYIYAATSRDHLGATITVPDTGQCKVTYTIQLTYPA